MINMANTVQRMANAVVTLRVQTIETVDFETVVTNVDTPLKVIAQPADTNVLVKASLDTSKEYLMIHALENIDLDNIIIYKSKGYNVVRRNPYEDYGYTEAIAELVK